MAGTLRLQICQDNAIAQRPELLEALAQEFPDLRVYTESCLDHCTSCPHCVFALVNGEHMTAKTPSAFMAKVRAQARKVPRRTGP